MCTQIICLVCYSFGVHQGHHTTPLGEHAALCRERTLKGVAELLQRVPATQQALSDAKQAIDEVNKVRSSYFSFLFFSFFSLFPVLVIVLIRRR